MLTFDIVLIVQFSLTILLVQCEYFTAITDMKILLNIEEKLIEQISASVDYQENQLNHIQE